jgi:hypothetical protein
LNREAVLAAAAWVAVGSLNSMKAMGSRPRLLPFAKPSKGKGGAFAPLPLVEKADHHRDLAEAALGQIGRWNTHLPVFDPKIRS